MVPIIKIVTEALMASNHLFHPITSYCSGISKPQLLFVIDLTYLHIIITYIYTMVFYAKLSTLCSALPILNLIKSLVESRYSKAVGIRSFLFFNLIRTFDPCNV